ncbi:MAG: HrgA protein [Alphaproteobacteria bacterium]|nr:HrgA protein [Alphaproteobacteria bacterium]MDA8012741.1 HrgA protein [Alphaproteobacteria bacterium]
MENSLRHEILSATKRLEKNHGILTLEERPKKFGLAKSVDAAENKDDDLDGHTSPTEVVGDGTRKLSESDLYPMLLQHLWEDLGIYGMRIDERHSRNQHGWRGNHWLHPDIVGVRNLSEDWSRKILDCVEARGEPKAELLSFEVKLEINRSNVRESFFQAVSNSSWANYGYLVAGRVVGSETMKELRILSNLHGIGFIRLDAEGQGQIEFQAREREGVDWDTANRLVEENRDFKKYIDLIRTFSQSGRLNMRDWNDVIDPGEED